MKQSQSNTDFYNQLATEYDQMISFEKAVQNKKKMLSKLISPKTRFAADLGCGSGVDSIALSSLGLKVDAFDPSSEMIKNAKENASSKNFKVHFYNYPIDCIPERFYDNFEFVISLGNTFANIEKEKFVISAEKCFNICKKSGILLIQILNYEKVVEEKQRIVNITKGERQYFIRFYDFNNDEIIFNILLFDKEKPSKNKLISTKLFPYGPNDFIKELKNAGFSSVEFFSDFNLSTFSKEQSKDLIIKAIKV